MRLLHFVPCFPTEPQKSTSSHRKHRKPDPHFWSIQAGWIRARGEIGFQLPCVSQRLLEGAAPRSGLSALYCRCGRSTSSHTARFTLNDIPQKRRVESTMFFFWPLGLKFSNSQTLCMRMSCLAFSCNHGFTTFVIKTSRTSDHVYVQHIQVSEV